MQNLLSEKIIEANNVLKNLVENSVSGSLTKKGNFGLADKVLFFISTHEGCTPSDIITEYNLQKTNLALVCKRLIDDGLIFKERDDIDGRAIKYYATKKGKTNADAGGLKLETKLSVVLNDKQKKEIEQCLDKIIKTFK